MLAGLHRAVEYLLPLPFGITTRSPTFAVSITSIIITEEFWDYLANFRFTGDVFAAPQA